MEVTRTNIMQVQEAGLSFYSYIILNRILHGHSRKVFISLYWTGIFVIFTFKLAITVLRLKDILNGNIKNVLLIDRMHIGYFVGIALVEMLSSYFLLRKFFSAQSSSMEIQSHVGLFSYLMRSTEIRLGILTLIGISRSITYSFQATAQSATNVAGQIDRFVVVLECMFPIVMLYVLSLQFTISRTYPVVQQLMKVSSALTSSPPKPSMLTATATTCHRTASSVARGTAEQRTYRARIGDHILMMHRGVFQ